MSILLGRPNHDLHYFIGENFCLEDAMENTITCSLQYPVSPPPVFQFSILSQNDTLLLNADALDNFTSTILGSEKSLSLSGTILPEELGITIVCTVSNPNGNDTARTSLTLCGKFQCKSSHRLSWPYQRNFHHARLSPKLIVN